MSGGIEAQSGGGRLRDRIEAAQKDKIEEVVHRPPATTPTGVGTAAYGHSTPIRDRQRWADYLKAEAAAPPAISSLADANLADHKRREAEKARQEAADIRSGKLVIIDSGYAERKFRADVAEREARLKEKLLEICYSQLGASDAEKKHVNALIREKFPTRFGDVDLHTSWFWKLRSECGESLK
jgi:hypothetical protein